MTSVMPVENYVIFGRGDVGGGGSLDLSDLDRVSTGL